MNLLHSNKQKKRAGLIALNPNQYIDFHLIKRKDISPDTRLFRFGLQSDKHTLGLPIGQHISLMYENQ